MNLTGEQHVESVEVRWIGIGIVLMGAALRHGNRANRWYLIGVYRGRHLGMVKSASRCGVFA